MVRLAEDSIEQKLREMKSKAKGLRDLILAVPQVTPAYLFGKSETLLEVAAVLKRLTDDESIQREDQLARKIMSLAIMASLQETMDGVKDEINSRETGVPKAVPKEKNS